MKRRARAGGVFTGVIQKRGRWYVAYVEEIPGVNTQGRTLGEARRNLRAALREVREADREISTYRSPNRRAASGACLRLPSPVLLESR